jgi:hypothetical protein
MKYQKICLAAIALTLTGTVNAGGYQVKEAMMKKDYGAASAS